MAVTSAPRPSTGTPPAFPGRDSGANRHGPIDIVTRPRRDRTVVSRWWRRVESFPVDRLRGLGIALVLLVAVGVAHALSMGSAPQRSDVEGVHVAHAWATQNLTTLARDTPWSDHPPGGWFQLAAWTWSTGTFERAPNPIAAGREAMLVAQLTSAVLLWVLARRLALPRWAAALAIGLFGLSPLAVALHRQALLENVATPWLLGAFVLASGQHQRPGAYLARGPCFASGACLGVAVLTRETSLLLLPALAWQFRRSTRPSIRWRAMTVAGYGALAVGVLYVAYAAVRFELTAVEGANNALDLLRFRLIDRIDAASLFGSGRRGLPGGLALDPVGTVLALVAAPVALLAMPRLRPIATAFIVPVAFLVVAADVAAPLLIAGLPFGALLIAGVADWTARSVAVRLTSSQPRRRHVPFAAVGALAGALAAPMWLATYRHELTADLDAPLREAKRWIATNVPNDRRLLVSDGLWIDLVADGFPPDQLELDGVPGDAFTGRGLTVAATAVRAGLADLEGLGGLTPHDLIASTRSLRATSTAASGLAASLRRSVPLAIFGSGTNRVEIRQVIDDRATGPTPSSAGPVSALASPTPAALVKAGAALARNPSIDFAVRARLALEAGEVDERLMATLAALAADRRLRVDEFPAIHAEAAAGMPRRAVVVLAETAPEARALAAVFADQDPPYRPASIEVDAQRVAVVLTFAFFDDITTSEVGHPS